MKTTFNVDYRGYSKKVLGYDLVEKSRDGDFEHDWVEMNLTPEELKYLLDKGIDVKTI